MYRTVLILFFLFAKANLLFCQVSKFDELSFKMFFNILSHKPDSCVYDFIKEHFPFMTAPVEKGGWTIYPPGSDTLPIPIKTMYSFNFKSHPLFKVPFREGRLEIPAQEMKGYKPRPSDFQLWFMFDTKKDAENAFEILSNMFNAVSKSKNIWSGNHRKIAEYSQKDTFDYVDAVQLILTADELYDEKYKLFFRLGAFTYRQ